ncbi:MAG: thiamine phosphate synthase [Deltaproteobacteria bacterium]|nr:thiamine phosphate synthase [Deltaproteobacteria bacterium]
MDKLYLITDRKIAKQGILKAIESAIIGGVRFIQLREKDLKGAPLLQLAKEVRELTGFYNAKLIINDRADIALLCGADGVHLGQNSFSPKDVRKILGKEKLIGVSTHSIKEAKAARDSGADFITFGPVFFTPSKAQYGEPVGIKLLRKVKTEIEIPVYALGGIKKSNIREVIKAGADGIALISAIMGSDNPQDSTIELINEISRVTD